MQIIQLAENPWIPLIKEAIDGLFDDANGVVWPPMKIGTNFCENVLCDIVERMVCDHLCRMERQNSE